MPASAGFAVGSSWWWVARTAATVDSRSGLGRYKPGGVAWCEIRQAARCRPWRWSTRRRRSRGLARSSTPRPGRFRAPLSGQKKALSTRTRPNDQHRASGRKMPALSAVSLNYRRARSFTRRPGHAGGHGRFLPPRGARIESPAGARMPAPEARPPAWRKKPLYGPVIKPSGHVQADRACAPAADFTFWIDQRGSRNRPKAVLGAAGP